MNIFALDTDTLSLWQYGHPLISQRIAVLPPSEIFVTVITVQEQLDGWHSQLPQARSAKHISELYRRLADTVLFHSRISILHYTEAAVHRFAKLKKQIPNVGKNDLRIAAIALEHQATVVTRNLVDFQRVPSLSVEDWSQ